MKMVGHDYKDIQGDIGPEGRSLQSFFLDDLSGLRKRYATVDGFPKIHERFLAQIVTKYAPNWE